jgi:hypothetical protein
MPRGNNSSGHHKEVENIGEITMIFHRGKSGTVIASRQLIKAEFEACNGNKQVRNILKKIKRVQDKMVKAALLEKNA